MGSIGDTVRTFFDSSYVGNVSPGQEGAAQTWAFPLNAHIPLDTTFFIDPANTPFASDFTNSNLCLSELGTYTFLNKSASKVEVLGLSVDLDSFITNTVIKVNPPITFLEFPLEYGDTYSSTGTGSITFPFQDTIDLGLGPIYVDSVRVEFTVTQADSVNGYGTLTIDSTTTDVLRVESYQIISLDLFTRIELIPGSGIFIWAPVPVSIIPDFQIRSVNYWGKKFDYPLLSFELDSSGDVLSNSYQLNPQVVGIADLERDAQIKVFPNPVREYIHIESSLPMEEIRIIDLLGEKVLVLENEFSENVLRLGELSPGVYLLEIELADGRIEQRRIIKH